jgi:methyl-accepting chemotaxis protein
LERILEKTRLEDELSAQIAVASSEQSRGIEQIASAINQVDGVTRNTAASAEEMASAAEELNGQVNSMRESVHDLLSLVHGEASALPAASLPTTVTGLASGTKTRSASARKPAEQTVETF